MAAQTGVRDFLSETGERSSLEKARFLVLPVPYEQTTSYGKGTAQGPQAVLDASSQVELWDEEVRLETWKDGICTLEPFGSEEAPEVFFPRLTERVRSLIARTDQTLFSIGGEHSITQALLAPFIEKYPRLSVFHIDAHADLRPEYEGSPHSHASALYPASRKVPLVQTGIRNIAPEEAKLAGAGKVKTFLAHENRDVRKLIPKALKGLTRDVYVTVDVDGFDPSVFPGTGTPQPGGLSWYDGLDLLRAVFEKRNVVGVDVMEIMPIPHSPISQFNGAKLLYRMMGWLAAKDRKGRRRNGKR